MKKIKKQIKSIALILSLLIMFQGCTVYKSASVTLEEAVMAETKVKVIKKNGEKVKFKRIIFEDGYYKSIEKIGEGTAKTQLEVEKIEKIQIKDKVLSTVLTVILVTPLVGIITLIATAKQGNTGPITWPDVNPY